MRARKPRVRGPAPEADPVEVGNTRLKSRVLSAVTFALTLIAVIAVGEGGARLYYYQREWGNYDTTRYRYDSELGWTLEDGVFEQKHKAFFAVYSIRDGRRVTYGDREASKGKIINIYGDSFAFGIGVNDDETIASVVAKMLSGYVVRNYGVPAYAPDQYYLLSRRTSKPDDINVFVVLTGNDYREIMPATSAGYRNYAKPVLIASEGGAPRFYWRMPVRSDDAGMAGGGWSSRFVALARNGLRNIPWAISVRNRLVSPDSEIVRGVVERMRFLFDDLDKGRTYFVVVPSLSLIQGISVATEEGLFERDLTRYLQDSEQNYLSVYARGVLGEEHYWAGEGHPNAAGNRVIGAEIVKMLLENDQESGQR